jgi:sec-independent protein translocase protein TatC
LAKTRPDPDKMTFLEHLGELRTRLVRCVSALVLGFVLLVVPPGLPSKIFHFITGPMRAANTPFEFIYTEPTEAFMLYMQMCFFAAIFMVSPYLLYQVWAFIAPGLYPHEKKYAVPFIVFGSLFFVVGGLFGHYVLFPVTFRFLGQYAGPDMSFKPKISEYFSFYSWFLLALGLVFQIPIIIFVLARIGLVTASFLMRNFKYAVLAAFIISAVITPSGDMVNQTVLAMPILGLYLLGALVAWIFGKPRRKEA